MSPSPMRSFFAQFRQPPWANQRVRWPIRYIAWAVAVLGVVALGATVTFTIIDGLPLRDLWFALKAIVGVGYLTALRRMLHGTVRHLQDGCLGSNT